MPKNKILSIAGCPFTNFGPCATIKCAFFVKAPHGRDGMDCLFRANYMLQITHNILLQSEFLRSSTSPERLPILPPLQRIVESLVSDLESLAGLSNHPDTGAKLKRDLRLMQAELSKALKTFADDL